MIEEPPSTSPESNKGLGFFKKIRLFLRGLYKRVSYTPMNQRELSGVLKEAEEMNLIQLPTNRNLIYSKLKHEITTDH
jgi:hypothetical protein